MRIAARRIRKRPVRHIGSPIEVQPPEANIEITRALGGAMSSFHKRAGVSQRLVRATVLVACWSLSVHSSYGHDLFSGRASPGFDAMPTGVGIMLQFRVPSGGDIVQSPKPTWSLSAGTTRQTTLGPDGVDFGYSSGIGVAFGEHLPPTLKLGSMDLRQSFLDRQGTTAGSTSPPYGGDAITIYHAPLAYNFYAGALTQP